jgi:hypothetical protein
MLKEFVDFFIALLELVEAEAVSARQGIARFALALMLGVTGGLFALGAAGLLIWALYLVLGPAINQPAALAICAAALIIIAGLSLCYARKILR